MEIISAICAATSKQELTAIMADYISKFTREEHPAKITPPPARHPKWNFGIPRQHSAGGSTSGAAAAAAAAAAASATDNSASVAEDTSEPAEPAAAETSTLKFQKGDIIQKISDKNTKTYGIVLKKVGDKYAVNLDRHFSNRQIESINNLEVGKIYTYKAGSAFGSVLIYVLGKNIYDRAVDYTVCRVVYLSEDEMKLVQDDSLNDKFFEIICQL